MNARCNIAACSESSHSRWLFHLLAEPASRRVLFLLTLDAPLSALFPSGPGPGPGPGTHSSLPPFQHIHRHVRLPSFASILASPTPARPCPTLRDLHVGDATDGNKFNRSKKFINHTHTHTRNENEKKGASASYFPSLPHEKGQLPYLPRSRFDILAP
ncbi:unnamed protein product [Cyclocybe aegerita]|uniref:Uncharacterized protein n=1 Tax=Cyclocybe aegerita TaxID=1973307 RepID=A0A8S0VY76_CYCAE|nr:unnamed protein product [Cyclocybe aegerita]